MEPARVEKSATRARQGAKGTPVLMILVASLAAIVILYFIIGAFMSETAPESATTGGPAAGISTAPATTTEGGQSPVVAPGTDQNATPAPAGTSN